MSQKPKLVFAISALLVAYVALTVAWLLPTWSELDTNQTFSLVRHLGVLLFIAGYLVVQPRLGSWFALAWCVFVPFERYALLFQEISRAMSGNAIELALVDVVRFFILFVAAILSALLVFKLYAHRSPPASANADA